MPLDRQSGASGLILDEEFPTSDEGDERIVDEEITGLIPSPDVPGILDQVDTGLPPSLPPVITTITSDNVVGAQFSVGNNLQYYNATDGKFYKIASNGKIDLLSDDVFFNVEHVEWSSQNNEAIIEYPDGANTYYNFDTQRQVTLPRHWESFSFSPQGDSIVAKSVGISEDNRWIVATDPDGKNIRLVEPMGNNADKVDINWSPNKQIIATTRTGQALGADREKILFVGLHGENFSSIEVEGRGFQSEWSPEGSKLMYSVYSARSDFKPELWIVDADPSRLGENRQSLRINTWAEKCNFSDERFLYCGVPIDLQTGAGFAPEIAQNSPDRLVRIDIQTGAQTEIPLGDDSFHVIDDIFINEETGQLMFTDKNQAGLFDVNI